MRRLFLVLVVTAACAKGKDAARGERTVQLAACVDAIEKAGAAPPGEQVVAVARGCPTACAGLAAWIGARGTAELRPGVLTDRGDPPGEALRDGCDPDVLPKDTPTLVSDEGLALAEISRWIDHQQRAGLDDPQLPARIEHVTAAATFALPLPAVPGMATARFRTPSHAREFVSIGDDLRIGTAPHVRLRGGRLDVLALPSTYPGHLVDLDQIGPALAQQAAQLTQMSLPPFGAPLVLAGETVPLARVLDVITRLGVDRAQIAVADDVTYAHPVVLERRGLNFALPEIDLGPTGITLRGFGDDRQTDWDHLDDELDNFAAVNAPIRAIELHPQDVTTMTELVRVLDACVVARIEAVDFIPAPR